MSVGTINPNETDPYKIVNLLRRHSELWNDPTQAQLILGIRHVLTASATYYVRTDGSDSNTGLANTAAGAFLTIQKAVDVAASLDLSLFSVTINIADGTYTTPTSLKSYIGVGPIIIEGNLLNPENVILRITSGSPITMGGVIGLYSLRGVTLDALTAGHNCMNILQQSVLRTSRIRYLNGNSHMLVTYGAQVFVDNPSVPGVPAIPEIVVGPMNIHWGVNTGGTIQCAGKVIDVPSPVTFGQWWGFADQQGRIIANANTFTGLGAGPASFGQCHRCSAMGLIDTGGRPRIGYFPGDVAGVEVTQGLYT